MQIVSAQDRILSLTPGLEIQARAIGGIMPWWLSGGVDPSTCLGAYQPKGAANLAASYANLANPALPLVNIGTAPAFNSLTGWGSELWGGQRLDTGISGAAGSWSMFYRYDATLYLAIPMGFWDTFAFFLAVDSNQTQYANLGSYFTHNGNPQIGGVIAMAGGKFYRNGALLGSLSYSAGTVAGTLKLISTDAGWYALTGNTQAAAIYNATLSDTQVTAISDAMIAL